jgi:chemotaxis methyl-accepting protein methylase
VVEQEADRDLEVVLDYLRRSRGFDFTGYKRASLSRRIEKRMRAVGPTATWTTSRSTPRSSPTCSTPS